MQQHQHHYIDRQRPRLMDNSQKTRNEEFYAKLERIRLATAAASSSKSIGVFSSRFNSIKETL